MIHKPITENPLKFPASIRNFSRTVSHLLERPNFSSPLIVINAGKMKSRKAVSKRFRATGAGRIIRSQCGNEHLNQKKTKNRKNNLSAYKIVVGKKAKNVSICLP